MALELQIINPSTEDGFLKEIVFNHEEIKQEVMKKVTDYKNLVYTEDTIKAAKTDVATLRKFKSALDDKRKELKKKCLEPYETFDIKIKEIIALVDDPIGLIDSQIKEVEEQKKIEKKGEILGFFNDNIGSLKGILSFDKVFKKEYLNATKKMKEIEQEIISIIEKVSSDLDTIESLDTGYEMQVKDYYLKTHDLSLALRENARLIDLAEKDRVRKEASRPVEETKPVESAKPEEFIRQTEVIQKKDVSSSVPEEQKETSEVRQDTEVVLEDTYIVGLDITGTRQQLDLFCKFLVDNNIRYEVTKKPTICEG